MVSVLLGEYFIESLYSENLYTISGFLNISPAL
jgi:hypothetical protein